MDTKPELSKMPITRSRHKCSACYKQYKKKEHLVEHMKISFHSYHQPRCWVCKKHCKSFESLREHLKGPLPKGNCWRLFADLGCDLCLRIFHSRTSLNKHKELCCLSHLGPIKMPNEESQLGVSGSNFESNIDRVPDAIAMDCEMVSGGSDGTLDLCVRVCLIDEDENLLFNTYVQPQIPVTNYRYEVTGLTEEHLKDAMPLKDVQDKIWQILYNGELIENAWLVGGKARLLVGHSLEHDLNCLEMNYPSHLLRDTAKYPPLMKTNLVSHSLKYLTRTYLGYEIQSGIHDPYEDCVSAMRLYKRIRGLQHPKQESITLNINDSLDSWDTEELEEKTPDELYKLSQPNYECWCLDLVQEHAHNN